MVDIFDTPEGRDILKIIEDGLLEVARSKKPQRDTRRPVTQEPETIKLQTIRHPVKA